MGFAGPGAPDDHRDPVTTRGQCPDRCRLIGTQHRGSDRGFDEYPIEYPASRVGARSEVVEESSLNAEQRLRCVLRLAIVGYHPTMRVDRGLCGLMVTDRDDRG